MSQVYRVGRDRENDIVLDDATVSRAHAELRMERNGDVLLVDLHSTNGTCIRDGNKWIEIDRATVDGGERILIGDVVTTVEALFARRDDMSAVWEHHPVGEHSVGEHPVGEHPVGEHPVGEHPENRDSRLDQEQAAFPAPANDAGRVPLQTVTSHPILAAPEAPEERSMRGISRRIASDFARLVFRPGREADTPSRPGERRRPSFRHEFDLPDDRDAAGEAEPASLIARRIGEQIGKRERLPSIQIEANPARRVNLSQTKPRRWLKPAVLSAAASMALVAAIAAVAVHGPGGDPTSGSSSRTARATQPGAPANPRANPPANPPSGRSTDRKDGPIRVADRRVGAGLPAGMFAFGGAKIDSFRAVAAMKGGGYLAVGSTESGGAGGFDLWLVRIGSNGATLWEKRFGGTGDDYGLTVVATADGGALVGGAADGRRFIWILRIDDKGDVRWSRRIEAGYRGHVTAIATARDGFAVAAVTEASKGAPTTSILLRLDKDGGTIWRRNFGPTYTWISSVQATYGAFVVAGVAKDAPKGRNALWVGKVDQMGKTIWAKRLALTGGRDAEAFARMARRGDIIVATTHQAVSPGGLWPTRHARIVRLNKDGDVIWRYLHAGNGRERVGGMVLVKGGILLAGTTGAPAGGKTGKSDLWLARIDTRGKTEWERHFGGAGADGASGFSQVGSRGFVLVGTTDRGAGKGRDGLLVTVDRAGRILQRAEARKE